MFTGLSTVATRRIPPRLGGPCARAARGAPSIPTPVPAAATVSHCRRVRWLVLRSLMLVPPLDHAILHHQPHAAHRRDVLHRVAVDRDQIGALAGLEASDLVRHPTRLRPAAGRGK